MVFHGWATTSLDAGWGHVQPKGRSSLLVEAPRRILRRGLIRRVKWTGSQGGRQCDGDVFSQDCVPASLHIAKGAWEGLWDCELPPQARIHTCLEVSSG